MCPSKARANEVNRALTTNDIACLGHLQHERVRPDGKENTCKVTRSQEKSPS